jgi:hypothetical protein
VAKLVTNRQSWARAFFKASSLHFRSPGGTSLRLRFRALFLALNFALLRSRFRAPALLDFSRSFFSAVRYHCGGSMELNASILLLADMVYL